MKNEKICDYPAFAAFGARLDLAQESKAALSGREHREIPGVTEQISGFSQGKITLIEIKSPLGARIMGKPQGKYVTIDAPAIRLGRDCEAEIAAAAARQLKSMLPREMSSVLLIGLGNDRATPDSLGPKTVRYSVATQHLLADGADYGHKLRSLCTLAPGVLGVTGIETAEIIRGVVERVRPSAIIAVDALAAASMSRVGTTLQLTDTGINPGSGVGNQREPINQQTLGIPVVAIGVPTVVSGSVIIYETLQALSRHSEAPPFLNDEVFTHIEQELLSAFEGRLMVTPKDIDSLSENIARCLAAAVAMAVHPGVDRHNYHLYLN